MTFVSLLDLDASTGHESDGFLQRMCVQNCYVGQAFRLLRGDRREPEDMMDSNHIYVLGSHVNLLLHVGLLVWFKVFEWSILSLHFAVDAGSQLVVRPLN